MIRVVSCLLLIVFNASAAHSEVRDVVNELRNGGCTARTRLAPLLTDKRLQSVATQVASGSTSAQATQFAGYPVKQLSTIHLLGYSREIEVRQLLAQKYCQLLMDPAWQQIGSDWQNNELWIVLATPHAIPSDAKAVTQQVLMLVNQARSTSRRCGSERYAASQPLRLNTSLNKAAQLHAQDMASRELMQHQGSNGSTPAQRITRQGYRWKAVGENVAVGAGSAEEVVAGWLASPGHCANIMSPLFNEMGVAFAVNKQAGYVVYWAQDFAAPR